MHKIFKDTLLKPNGKWDSRKLTAFTAFILGSLCGVFVTISDFLLTKEINPYAIAVVGLFFSLATGQTIVSTWNKKVDNSLGIDQEPNNQYSNDTGGDFKG